MSHADEGGASRRDVLKGGALGMGALASVMGVAGLGSQPAEAAVATPDATASGAVDYFLKLDGIDGESTDSQHKGEIVIESFSWGASNTTPTEGGAGAGKAVAAGFTIQKKLDRSSPLLMLACCNGQHIKTGVLSARRRIGKELSYLKIDLTDILVSSYHTAGGSSGPTEQLSLNFQKIEVVYYPEDAKGNLGKAVTGSFTFGAQPTD